MPGKRSLSTMTNKECIELMELIQELRIEEKRKIDTLSACPDEIPEDMIIFGMVIKSMEEHRRRVKGFMTMCINVSINILNENSLKFRALKAELSDAIELCRDILQKLEDKLESFIKQLPKE